MNVAKRLAWIIAILALVLPALGSQIPPPTSDLPPRVFQATLVASILIAWLHMGAALLFLAGLKGFKTDLRRAYILLCVGLFGMVLTQLQVPFLMKLDLFRSSWVVTYGGLSWPYAVAMLLIYVGIVMFARKLEARNTWTTPAVMIPIVATLAAVGGLLVDEGAFNSYFASNIVVACFTFIAVGLTWRIKHETGAAYTYALAWFFITFLANVFVTLPPLIFAFLDKEPVPIMALGSVAMGLLFIKAGYAFNTVKEY